MRRTGVDDSDCSKLQEVSTASISDTTKCAAERVFLFAVYIYIYIQGVSRL
jgi:hypothetical protein